MQRTDRFPRSVAAPDVDHRAVVDPPVRAEYVHLDRVGAGVEGNDRVVGQFEVAESLPAALSDPVVEVGVVQVTVCAAHVDLG